MVIGKAILYRFANVRARIDEVQHWPELKSHFRWGPSLRNALEQAHQFLAFYFTDYPCRPTMKFRLLSTGRSRHGHDEGHQVSVPLWIKPRVELVVESLLPQSGSLEERSFLVIGPERPITGAHETGCRFPNLQ